MAAFNVQQQHTRNSHDWSVTTAEDGRIALKANKKGLRYRISMVFGFLARQDGRKATRFEILNYLQTLSDSYTDTDLSQVHVQLRKNNLIKSHGRGGDAVWALTSHAEASMKKASFKWV